VSIITNLRGLQRRITQAAERAGRNPRDITLMAVTKTVSPERIREAYDAGIRVFGENRVQEFESKLQALHDLDADWHMIGHLQSNKSAKATELFAYIDSVDSVKLAQRLNAAASQLGRRMPILIEINIGGETAKSGLAPESSELEEILAAAPQLPSLDFRGLMTVPPYFDDPEQSRPYFRRMRDLFDQLRTRGLPGISFEALSMGMSHDFEAAIEEGSTCVRIGTAIFGERPQPQ
jgi:PLP dependent protein